MSDPGRALAVRVKRTAKRFRGTGPGQAVEAGVNELWFQRDRAARRRQYPRLDIPPVDETVRLLRRDGFAVLPGVGDLDALARLAREFDACLSAGRHLNRPTHDAIRPAGETAEASALVSDDDIAGGEERLRHLTNYLSVDEPFVACPAAVELAFTPLLLRIAGAYLGCPPAVGGVNLRRSFVNDLTEFDTLFFHSDPNSPRFLKFFFYLNDVDEGGGPFAYIPGTHRQKFRGWRRKYRWTPEEIETIYPGRVRLATARVGDLVIADTTGFHRGTKVVTRDRTMLTVNMVVHREFHGRQVGFKLPRAATTGFTPAQQAGTDFLDLVDS